MTKPSFDSPAEPFRTHANYIRAFGRIAAQGKTQRRNALDVLAERFRATHPRTRGTPLDAAAALRSLTNAWSTELLLDLTAATAPDDEFVRLANNWAVIQTYYTFYHATQALAQAKGFARPQRHLPTQKHFASFWAEAGGPLQPWALCVKADGLKHAPSSISVDDASHAWSPCTDETCWSLAAKALRTTREYAVKKAYDKQRERIQSDRRKAWAVEEEGRRERGRRPRKKQLVRKPNLTVQEKEQVANRVRGHTIMDYLWRLRIRTNYEDSAMFTDGPEDDKTVSTEIRDCLRWLTCSTLFIHELALLRLLGRGTLLRAMDTWLHDKAPPALAISLRERRDLLLAFGA